MRSVIAACRFVGLLCVVALVLPPAVLVRAIGQVGARGWSMRTGVALQAWWARASCWMFGVRIELEGDLPEGAHLICANHRGYLDILVLAARLPGRFVAMHELSGWPLLGWMAWSSGTLFIKREDKRHLLAVGPRLESCLAEGVSVILFPEGRSGSGEALGAFKTPLFEAAVRVGAPCQAVALSYETPGVPWSTAWTVSWWGGMGLRRHALRCLKLPRVHARLRVAGGPRTGRDRKTLAAGIAAELESALEPVRLHPQPPDNPWPGN